MNEKRSFLTVEFWPEPDGMKFKGQIAENVEPAQVLVALDQIVSGEVPLGYAASDDPRIADRHYLQLVFDPDTHALIGATGHKLTITQARGAVHLMRLLAERAFQRQIERDGPSETKIVIPTLSLG